MLFGRKNKDVFDVTGMSCGHCEAAVEKAVGAVAGVKKVKASHTKSRVEVSYAQELDADAVRKAITDAGYEVTDAPSAG